MKGSGGRVALLAVVMVLIIATIYFLEKGKAGFVAYLPGEEIAEVTQPQNLPPKIQNQGLTGTAEANGQQEIPQDRQNGALGPPRQAQLTEDDRKRIAQKEKKYQRAPELTGLTGYRNGAEEGLRIADVRGKIVLVDFWTYTCINCIRTLPHLIDWDRTYRDNGLVIIGVHTPEFEFEKDPGNVDEAIKKYGITYRVVQDNDYRTWRAFRNRYWPRKYLIDGDGFIRYDHIGEGGYEQTEEMIQSLLEEIGETGNEQTSTIEDATPKLRTTPELYAGFDFALPRGQNIGNEGGMRPDDTVMYSIPDEIQSDTIYLDGLWKSNADNLMAAEAQAAVVLGFTASSVNIVADAPNPIMLEVYVGDAYVTKEQAGSDVVFEDGRAYILVDKPLLYNVVSGAYGSYTLKLVAKGRGFSFNAFTFG